jgi:glycosyltransferase involved in cell wall biosynthesis
VSALLLSPVASPHVTVVIPAFNAATTIGRALDSVAAQTVRPKQVLVVDDGSSEDLAFAVARFRSSVQVIRKKHGGVASARNCGIAAATGDVVAFLDADDYWEPDKLALQLAILSQHPEVGMVAARLHLEQPVAGLITRRLDCRIDMALCDRVLYLLDGETESAFDAARQFWTGTVLVRRELFKHERFAEDLSTAEDRDMWFRLLRRAPAYILGVPLATHVIGPKSLSRGDIDRDCRNMLSLLERHRRALGATAYRRWVSDVHWRWAMRLLAENRPQDALAPALHRLFSHPSPRAMWTVGKSVLLTARTVMLSIGARR